MPFKKFVIDSDKIESALVNIYKYHQLEDDFFERFNSHHKQNVWYELCKKILPDSFSSDTIKKYQFNCATVYNRYKKRIINNLKKKFFQNPRSNAKNITKQGLDVAHSSKVCDEAANKIEDKDCNHECIKGSNNKYSYDSLKQEYNVNFNKDSFETESNDGLIVESQVDNFSHFPESPDQESEIDVTFSNQEILINEKNITESELNEFVDKKEFNVDSSQVDNFSCFPESLDEVSEIDVILNDTEIFIHEKDTTDFDVNKIKLDHFDILAALDKISIEESSDDEWGGMNQNESNSKIEEVKPKESSTKLRIDRKSREDFKHAETLVIPASFWEKNLPKDGSRSLKKGWTNDLNEIFEKKFPYCVLSFYDSRYYTEKKKTSIDYFWAKACCIHSTCTNFHFAVDENIKTPHCDHVMKVFHDEIDHSAGEKHRRFFNGEIRDKFSKNFRGKTGYLTKVSCVNKAPDHVLSMGNYNSTPSKSIISKMKSDARKKKDLDKDYCKYMEKLIEKFKEKYKDCEVIKGYIQFNAQEPIFIVMFSEPQLRVVASMKEIFLFLDATGSVAAQPQYCQEKLTIYYYGLFMPGGPEFSPLEAAEAILSVHDTDAVRFFLSQFRNKLKLITTKTVKKIETDFSLVLLHAACQTFNDMNLYQYINYLYSEENKENKKDLTILHSCSSHLIKALRKKIFQCFPDKKNHKPQRSMASKIMSGLIHAESIEAAKPFFELFVKLFMLEKKDSSLKVEAEKIENTQTAEEINFDSYEPIASEDNQEGEVLPPEDEGKKKSSMYYQHFLKIKNDILKNCDLTEEPNEFFSEKFSKYVLEFLMPYFPVWSGVGLKRFGLTRDCNATAENGFKILKHQVLEKEKHIMIPRLLQKNEEVIESKIKERKFPLKTTRQLKNEAKKESEPGQRSRKRKRKFQEKSETGHHEAVERWEDSKRIKTNSGPNRYLRQKKKYDPEDLKKHLDDAQQNTIKIFNALTKSKIKSKTTQKAKKEIKRFEELENDAGCDTTTVPEKVIENNFQKNDVESSIPEMIVEDTEILNLKDTSILFKKGRDYPPGFPNIEKRLNGLLISKKILQSWRSTKTRISG